MLRFLPALRLVFEHYLRLSNHFYSIRKKIFEKFIESCLWLKVSLSSALSKVEHFPNAPQQYNPSSILFSKFLEVSHLKYFGKPFAVFAVFFVKPDPSLYNFKNFILAEDAVKLPG